MASQTGENDPGGSRQEMLSELRSRDLPSKRLLGKGLAGIGYETEWHGLKYARKDFVGVPDDIFRTEANVLIGLKDHRNVVKTHGMTVDKLSCSLVLEYMDDKVSGLLQKRKDQRKRRPAGTDSGKQSELSRTLPFELPEALYFILQIARGMEYLHGQGISHGDLKTRNILVTYRNDDDKNLLSVKSVKVADFGLVQTKRTSMSYVSRQARKLDMVRWKAPESREMLLLEATSSKSDSDSDEECTGSGAAEMPLHSADVYCFALICFQILTGEEPYPKRKWKEMVGDIVSGQLRPILPLSCPQELSEVLESCWGKDATQRPPFSYIRDKLEQLEKDYCSMKPTESVEPISIFSESLRVIEDVTSTSTKFSLNKYQSERLASRLNGIGKKLKKSPKEFLGSQSSDAGNKMGYPAFDKLLTVLRQAKDLLSKFRESKPNIPIVLNQTANREIFKEVHAELDRLNSHFHFEDLESSSEIGNFAVLTGDADEDLELSTSRDHWSEIGEDDFDEEEVAEIGNAEVFKTLQMHPKWGRFFHTFGEGELVMGQKYAEDAQATFYEAQVHWRSPLLIEDDLQNRREWALKVFEMGIDLRDLQRLWPLGMLEFQAERLERGELTTVPEWFSQHCEIIACATLLTDGRFAFLTEKPQEYLSNLIDCKMIAPDFGLFVTEKPPEDSITLIDHKMIAQDSGLLRTDLPPKDLSSLIDQDYEPFSNEVAEVMMYQIALGMDWLHSRNIVHRDLKASNVFFTNHRQNGFWSLYVANFESSIGMVGTGFFRAPEILQACKDRNTSHREEIFTRKVDIYSYGMTCYQILTRKYPFEGHQFNNYDLVLNGACPMVPEYVDVWAKELLESCWQPNPEERPTFGEILKLLSANSEAIRSNLVLHGPSDNLVLEAPSETLYLKAYTNKKKSSIF